MQYIAAENNVLKLTYSYGKMLMKVKTQGIKILKKVYICKYVEKSIRKYLYVPRKFYQWLSLSDRFLIDFNF